MKRVGLIILILVATCLLGEIALVLGYIVLTVVAWIWFKQRWISVSVSAICLTALILHSLGFKFYGAAVIDRERESLTNARRAIALESPSKVVFEGGTSIQLLDVFFPKSLSLLEGKTNYHGVFQDRFGIYARLGHDQYHQEWITVEVQNLSTNTSKAMCLRKATYGCGNTWFPTLFPRRLPRHLREDLAVTLVHAGVALPTVEHVTNANPYYDPLMKALRSGDFWNLSTRSPEVVRLGRLLIESQPDYFETGANLLMHVEDVESYPRMIAEIKKRRGNKLLFVEELDSYGSYAGLLTPLDMSEAEKLMAEFSKQKEPHAFWATEIAGLLAKNGDLSGFDFLVSVLAKADVSVDYRQSLGTQLTSRFCFLREFNHGWGMPERISMLFPEWYVENRQSLKWSKHPDGGGGFALTSSGVFDETYFTTMEKYLAKANSVATQ